MNTYIAALLENWNIKLAIGTSVTFLASFFGEDAWLIAVLFGLIFADLVLGITSAIRYGKGLSGKRLHGGMIKFLSYGASIVLVWLVQEIVLRSLHLELPVLAVFAAYQCLTELSSVTRHLERLGLKMPKLLHRLTEAGTKKVDEKLDNVLGEEKKEGEE